MGPECYFSIESCVKNHLCVQVERIYLPIPIDGDACMSALVIIISNTAKCINASITS